MLKQTKKVESERNDLMELNKSFHERKTLPDSFYKQLMEAGFRYRQCLLVSIFPDSGNTHCGKIIRQDGTVIEFDIDLDAAEFSLWEDVTDDFRQICEKNKHTRPWLKEVVAYNIFLRSEA